MDTTPVALPRLSPCFHLGWKQRGDADSLNMDASETGGGEKEKEKVIKRRNRPVFLRYLERRKTDTIVAEDTVKGDINLGTLVRRSQSDKTEYSAKLKGTTTNDLPGSQNYGNNIHRHTRGVKNSLDCGSAARKLIIRL